MVHLQKIHEDYGKKGLVVLGFNCADDRKIALKLIEEKKVTFPNILDSCEQAVTVAFQCYHATGVPLNYVIDKEGRVARAWYGYRKDDRETTELIEELLGQEASSRPDLGKKSRTKTSKDAVVSNWTITLGLGMPELDPPAVIVALLDEDPIPGLEARMRASLGWHREALKRVGSEEEKAVWRRSFLDVTWDGIFSIVSGDRVSLLTASRGAGREGGITLSSSQPASRKWVVTKSRTAKGKPVCWCIPVNLVADPHPEIILSRKSLFDLVELYEKLMK